MVVEVGRLEKGSSRTSQSGVVNLAAADSGHGYLELTGQKQETENRKSLDAVAEVGDAGSLVRCQIGAHCCCSQESPDDQDQR
jgi:hypothetical protein